MRKLIRIVLLVIAVASLGFSLSGVAAVADQVGPGPNAPVADQVGPGA